MRVIKDVFFANVTGSPRDNHYLDLYLPDQYDEARKGENGGSVDDVDINFVLESNTGTGSKQKHCDRVSDCDNYAETINEVKPGGECKNDMFSDVRDGKLGVSRATGAPLVIFVHGGGWRRGGREAWTHYLYFDVNFLLVLFTTLVGTYKNVGKALAKSGIACAVISYPLTEAGPACLLTELFLSYLQSCFAVLLVSMPVLGIFLIEFGLPWSRSSAWGTVFHDNKSMHVKTFILSIMLATNIITTSLLAFKRKKYNLRPYQIRTMWIMLAAGALLISFVNGNKLILFVLLTLIVNQSIILRLRLTRCDGCYEDQTRVLAKAVKWAKTAGQDPGMFDTSRVYLMGHSAGGHLVSLTVLDDNILSNVGCSSKDIKGVVSLSGVYDLLCLRGPFLRPFYLLPTFGHSHSTWLRASPSHLIRQKNVSEDTPKFLLMTAENDLFLKQQSWRFSEILQEAEVDCRHIEVLGTNHFTIVTSLMKKFTGNDKSVLSHIMHFILK